MTTRSNIKVRKMKGVGVQDRSRTTYAKHRTEKRRGERRTKQYINNEVPIKFI